ncbi:hypothetical protein [Hymenobacter metallilatus]|uniref:Lipoprotein n=1 Tax=Hymenobacter metallilatus TaxID=2493666 RepID=A0A428IZB3_9BACT|nr:hypothetical protein [Hymenobacter metallilatus]RSK24765.1 hypothetical protein EI290_19110 [Hymenobacter metallilatus]
MLRKTITLQALAATLLLGSVTLSSCNQAQKQEVSAESDQAYNDFKAFVASTEAKTEAVASEAQADYDRETAELKSDFDAKVAAVDRYADQYDDARRQEIEQLRTRYTTAYDKREMAWRNRPGATAAMTGTETMKMGQYYKPSSPASRLTAANARQTYEAFVNDIKQNENRYDIDDWRNINAEWRALDEAYDKVKKDIPAGDLAEIQKEKLKYAAFKSYDKAEARAAQGADATARGANNVAAETQDERSAVGRAASNTATDVKDAGKKVGGAVKGAFKEVKSEVKNTDND